MWKKGTETALRETYALKVHKVTTAFGSSNAVLRLAVYMKQLVVIASHSLIIEILSKQLVPRMITYTVHKVTTTCCWVEAGTVCQI